MPTSEIIDLDLALGEPITVKLNDAEYRLPSDIPAPLYLKINALAGREDLTLADIAEETYADILALFQVYQPEMDRVPATLGQLIALPARVYGGGGPGDAAEADPPKAKAGTKSTSRKRKGGSASTS